VESLDRREKAPDSSISALESISQKYGFPARAIVSMDEVIEALYTKGNKEVITEEIKKELDLYYQQWGAK